MASAVARLHFVVRTRASFAVQWHVRARDTAVLGNSVADATAAADELKIEREIIE